MIYGDLPEDLSLIDLSPTEMMFWMYCPVVTPTGAYLPENLSQFRPILRACFEREGLPIQDKYVYLTAKTLWVSGDYIGNRPGWHSDGFGTDDVNYIWYDRAPTEFYQGRLILPTQCDDAMKRMEDAANERRWAWQTFPDKHLLRLTPSVIHRSPVSFEPGMRTFVKVSISRDQYNLEGNSVNHGLPSAWQAVPRKLERNHTSAK
jgi:hypothetical protein